MDNDDEFDGRVVQGAKNGQKRAGSRFGARDYLKMTLTILGGLEKLMKAVKSIIDLFNKLFPGC